MYFGKVIGSLWATRKDERLNRLPLRIVQPVNARTQPDGNPIIAVDTVGAAVGETVFYITSREAVIPLPVEEAPVDASIVGIVDRLDPADMESKR